MKQGMSNLILLANYQLPAAKDSKNQNVLLLWRGGVVGIITVQLHSTMPELSLCAGSNPACNVSKIGDGENLCQWSPLEIRLTVFGRSNIPQKQFIIILIITNFRNPTFLDFCSETCKHSREILRSQPTADASYTFRRKLDKSSHNTSNQETRGFLKKCKLCDSSHHRSKRSAYEKVCYVYNKKNYFKVYSQRVGKIVYEIERDETDDRFYQSDYEFFIETITITNSLHINQIKNENSDRSIILPSNGAPVWYKTDTS